ncbi:MAG: DUF2007 domain-containing protein [Chloroflexi bacterium]|nr:DUF2007 domain-containing protein [Chloroflexota bacterium]
MAKKDVSVATFNFETEALMWADILAAEGIPCVLVPLGVGAGGWGASVWRPFEIRVREADADRARTVLAPYLQTDDDWSISS